MRNLEEDLAPDHETDVRPPVYSPGGSGANTTYAVAKLGLRAGVAGVITDDPNGQILKHHLEQVRINTGGLLVLPYHESYCTGRTIVFLDGIGRRSIYVDPGVNASLAEGLIGSGIDLAGSVAGSQIVHMSSFVSLPERRLCEDLVSAILPGSLMTLTPGSLYAKLGLDSIGKLLQRSNVVFLYQAQLRTLLDGCGFTFGSELRDRPGLLVRQMIAAFFMWRTAHTHEEPILLSVKRAGMPGTTMSAPDYLVLACGRREVEQFAFPSIGLQPSHSPRAFASGLGAGDALAAGVIFSIFEGMNLQSAADAGYLLANYCSNEVDSRSGLPDREELLAKLSR